MSVAILLARLQQSLTLEERKLFQAEQQCRVAFAKLPVVRRVFLGA